MLFLKHGKKIDFLKDNPQVCITIIDDWGSREDECSHSYRSVVIKGKMIFVDDEDETWCFVDLDSNYTTIG